jgi:hypothetical protein
MDMLAPEGEKSTSHKLRLSVDNRALLKPEPVLLGANVSIDFIDDSGDLGQLSRIRNRHTQVIHHPRGYISERKICWRGHIVPLCLLITIDRGGKDWSPVCIEEDATLRGACSEECCAALAAYLQKILPICADRELDVGPIIRHPQPLPVTS